jgi:hypothetical protein
LIYAYKNVAFIYIDYEKSQQLAQLLDIKVLPTLHIGRLRNKKFVLSSSHTGGDIKKLKDAIITASR